MAIHLDDLERSIRRDTASDPIELSDRAFFDGDWRTNGQCRQRFRIGEQSLKKWCRNLGEKQIELFNIGILLYCRKKEVHDDRARWEAAPVVNMEAAQSGTGSKIVQQWIECFLLLCSLDLVQPQDFPHL
jgi:hypothetical protein